jgi:hypothetical protein
MGARRADALARTRLRLIDSSRLAARFSSSGWRVGVPRRRPRDGADTAYVSCARFPESRRTSAKHGSWQAACRRRSAVARRAMADTVMWPTAVAEASAVVLGTMVGHVGESGRPDGPSASRPPRGTQPARRAHDLFPYVWLAIAAGLAAPAEAACGVVPVYPE